MDTGEANMATPVQTLGEPVCGRNVWTVLAVTVWLVALTSIAGATHLTCNGKSTTVGGDGTNSNDVIDLPGGAPDVVQGLDGADTVATYDDADLICGGNGDDSTLQGLNGDDEIHGNVGNDVIYGNAGNDFIHGGAYGDFIYGGDHSDTALYGDDGNDTMAGNAGTDVTYGGNGTDWCDAETEFACETGP